MSVVIKGNSNINLDFSTGGRITGDFSNATHANRVGFQSSTTNGNTIVGAIPNGTGVTSVFRSFNASDPTNAGQATLGITTAIMVVESGISGTGTYVPMTFSTGGSERLRIDTSGNVGLGTNSPNERLRINGDNNATARIRIQNQGTDIAFLGSALGISGFGNGNDLMLSSASTNNLTFGTNTAERMRIDASGNVGIGTIAPAGKLHVAGGNAGVGNVYLSGRSDASFEVNVSNIWARNENANFDGARIKFDVSSSNGLMMFHTATGGSLVERMRITSAGDLLVGTTSAPKSWGAASPKMRVTAGGIQFGDYSLITEDVFDIDSLCLVADSTESICFGQYVNATGVYTERARIDSGGTLCVNTTTASPGVGAIQASARNSVALGTNASASYYSVANYFSGSFSGGLFVTSGATSLVTSSDYRLKNITGPITTSGAYIDSLNPVEGTWKGDGAPFVGLIAHEVQEISRTQVATGAKDGEQMQAMTYSSPEMIANLIAEVKSLRIRVAQLEAP
jgi:hypothetical protein